MITLEVTPKFHDQRDILVEVTLPHNRPIARAPNAPYRCPVPSATPSPRCRSMMTAAGIAECRREARARRTRLISPTGAMGWHRFTRSGASTGERDWVDVVNEDALLPALLEKSAAEAGISRRAVRQESSPNS
jgi:hypothetical protein